MLIVRVDFYVYLSVRMVDQGVETLCQALQLNHSVDKLYLQR